MSFQWDGFNAGENIQTTHLSVHDRRHKSMHACRMGRICKNGQLDHWLTLNSNRCLFDDLQRKKVKEGRDRYCLHSGNDIIVWSNLCFHSGLSSHHSMCMMVTTLRLFYRATKIRQRKIFHEIWTVPCVGSRDFKKTWSDFHVEAGEFVLSHHFQFILSVSSPLDSSDANLQRLDHGPLASFITF